MTLNDRGSDDVRARIAPFMVRAIGTAGDGRDPERRELARVWLIRTALPDWMEAAGCLEVAQRFRDMPDGLVEENLLRLIWEAHDEARGARYAARDRLWDALKKALLASGVSNAAYASAGAEDAAEEAAYAYAHAYAFSASAGAEAAAYAFSVWGGEEAAACVGFAAAYAAYAGGVAPLVSMILEAHDKGESIYNAVYAAVSAEIRPTVDAKFGPLRDRHFDEVIDLFDRMLPAEPNLTVEQLERARLLGVVA
jgi:hypothetical protein